VSASEFDIRSIVGIARIPEDAFPRFLAEFPLVVSSVRAHILMMESLHEAGLVAEPTDAIILEAIAGLRWIDDDKGNVAIRVDAQDAAGSVLNLLKIQGNHKTGEVSVEMAHDRDSDRSGEAMETGTGSTSGESAGRNGIAQPPSQSPSPTNGEDEHGNRR